MKQINWIISVKKSSQIGPWKSAPDWSATRAICRRRVPANELKDRLIEKRRGDRTRLEASRHGEFFFNVCKCLAALAALHRTPQPETWP